MYINTETIFSMTQSLCALYSFFLFSTHSICIPVFLGTFSYCFLNILYFFHVKYI